MFGFLNVYKPRGLTSHDVVARLRRITKIKQIGHTGTLDPFAEGVLPICIGKSTRLIEYLADDKAYEAVVQFGKSTNTYDLEGEETFSTDKIVNVNDIRESLSSFRGEILQKAPLYSAIKKNGRKLYEYARSGEFVELPVRSVTIYKLELLDFDESLQQARLLVECSKGTYIRSLANDLGEMLGVGGHLIRLVRIKAGAFEVDKTVSLDGLDEGGVKNVLISPLQVLNYRKYGVSEVELGLIRNGCALSCSQVIKDLNLGEILLLTFDNEIVSVAEFDGEKLIQKKVFI